MLDKAIVNTKDKNVILSEALCARASIKIIRRCQSTYYSERYICETHTGQKIIIQNMPKFCDKGFSISFNPSHWNSFGELDRVLKVLSSGVELFFSRVDYNVDLHGIPLNAVHQSLFIERKKWRVEYSDGVNLSGIYLGKQPEYICIYNKGARDGLDEMITRVELRLYGDKIPISKYSEFSQLAERNPFQKIQFIKPCPPTKPRRDRNEKYARLSEFIQTKGCHGAIKTINKMGNFKRDYGSVYKINNEIPDLWSICQKEIIHFLGGKNESNNKAD